MPMPMIFHSPTGTTAPEMSWELYLGPSVALSLGTMTCSGWPLLGCSFQVGRGLHIVECGNTQEMIQKSKKETTWDVGQAGRHFKSRP